MRWPKMITRVSGIIWSLHPMCGSYRAHLDGYICWITHHLNTHLLLAMGCHAINCNNKKPQQKTSEQRKDYCTLVVCFETCYRIRKTNEESTAVSLVNSTSSFLWRGSHALQTIQGCGALDWNILTWKDQADLEGQFSLAPCQGCMSNKQCWGKGDSSEM